MTISKAAFGVPLVAAQLVGLSAGQTDWKSISGFANTSGQDSVLMLSPGPDATQPDSGIKWHVTGIVVEPGVLNPNNPNAVYPDIQMWMSVDSVVTKPWWIADLSQPRLMYPPRRLSAGRHYRLLGKSMYKAAVLVNRGLSVSQAFGGSNWPLLYGGPKVANDLVLHFSSASGFTTGLGPTDTFAVAPIVRLWGDAYDATTWAYVVRAMGPQGWRGSIRTTSLRREQLGLVPFTAIHQVPAGIANFAGDGFLQLPDGAKQTGGAKVYSYQTWVTNSNAFVGNNAYVLTNEIKGLGKPGQVPGDGYDLGFPFLGTQSCVQVDRFGRLPVAGSGYWGIASQGGPNSQKRYPFDSDYGQLDTVGDPHFWYGYAEPYNGKDEYEIMGPSWDGAPGESGSEVFAYENAAYFSAALGNETVAANTEYHAVSGQYITS